MLLTPPTSIVSPSPSALTRFGLPLFAPVMRAPPPSAAGAALSVTSLRHLPLHLRFLLPLHAEARCLSGNQKTGKRPKKEDKVTSLGEGVGAPEFLKRDRFLAELFSPLQDKGPFGASNMPPYSKSIHSGGPVVGAPYKTEMVGGCEVYHKNLIYGDITIHFVECGKLDGELVILVHGFPNFWFLWKNQFKALAEAGYHVIAPDLRGYNSSSRPSGVENYGVDQLSHDLLQLVDCCSKNQAVTMVGHDWGGAAVWAFAESHSNKLKGIIIVNSPHFDSFRNLYQKSLRQRLRSWYFVFFQLPVIPEAFLQFNRFWALRRALKISSLKGQSEEDIDRYVEAYSSPGALTGMISYYRAVHAGYWSKMGKTPVRIPVKVVWGELDRYLDRQLATPPKTLVPDATVLLLPQVSHWPMWDDPQLFNQALLKFLP